MPRRSALHFVAATGNLACTKLLVDAGADLNLGDKDGAPRPSRGRLHAGWCKRALRPCACLALLTAARR